MRKTKGPTIYIKQKVFYKHYFGTEQNRKKIYIALNLDVLSTFFSRTKKQKKQKTKNKKKSKTIPNLRNMTQYYVDSGHKTRGQHNIFFL